MKQLFLDIQNKILTEVPEITYVRIFNNQFENSVNENNTYDFPFPCLFVEFLNDQQPKQLGGGYQLYEPLLVRCHIGMNELDATDGTLDQNLNIFDLKNKVYKALQKFEPTGASVFIRTSEQQDYQHTNIYVWQMDFTTTWIDQNRTEPLSPTVSTPPTQLIINPIDIVKSSNDL